MCIGSAGPRLWSNLPAHLRHTEVRFEQFRRLLKIFYFSLSVEIAANCSYPSNLNCACWIAVWCCCCMFCRRLGRSDEQIRHYGRTSDGLSTTDYYDYRITALAPQEKVHGAIRYPLQPNALIPVSTYYRVHSFGFWPNIRLSLWYLQCFVCL